MKTILLVDDDIHILDLVSIHLTQAGYNIMKALNGIEALKVLHEHNCDLAVVDVMMPYMDGYSLTKEIRKNYDIPIILLTAKSQIDDKEMGFHSGTDDYLVKPFEPKELLFRIHALLRRYYPEQEDTMIQFGQTIINKKNYEVQVGQITFLLPLKEFELLTYLASNPTQVFSRDQLIQSIWGIDYEGDERTVDVHIKRLRERFSKVNADFQIKTIRGIGYLLEGKKL